MARIVVSGGGICGLGASMMLARRGHDVTVLERNPEPPPESIDAAWEAWERPGVGQFRMGHYFLAKFHQVVKAELPDLLPKFDAAGALRLNPVLDGMPATMSDPSPRDDDDLFDVITARRPVFECVIAAAAADEPRLDIRRGVAVTGLCTGAAVIDGVPHVTGVVTDAGDRLDADLVIDAGGRRSAFASWLTTIGGRPFYEDSQDSGFRYYGRYFKSGSGQWPTPPLPTLSMLGTVAVLALPADNVTWMVGVVASARDKALYGLADADAWTRVVAATPAIAPFLEGEPITAVETMAAIPDRYRRFVVDGQPIATGVTAIADAWAATNPMRGRGVSMGLAHAQGVINQLGLLDDPAAFAHAVDAVTEAELAPHYHGTVELDRGMREAWEREIDGVAPPAAAADDPAAAIQGNLFAMLATDPDAWRGFMKIVNLLDLPMNVIASEPLFSKLLAYSGDPAADPFGSDGPTRQQLVDIASTGKSVADPDARWDVVQSR